METTITKLQQLTGEALDALKGNLTCGEAPAENTAARAILEFSFRAMEDADLAQQLAELKQEVERLMTYGNGDHGQGLGPAAFNGDGAKPANPSGGQSGAA
jgi:hypothetical protein